MYCDLWISESKKEQFPRKLYMRKYGISIKPREYVLMLYIVQGLLKRFLCPVFLIDLLTYSYENNFQIFFFKYIQKNKGIYTNCGLFNVIECLYFFDLTTFLQRYFRCQDRNLSNFFVGFLKNLRRQRDILKLNDLQI